MAQSSGEEAQANPSPAMEREEDVVQPSSGHAGEEPWPSSDALCGAWDFGTREGWQRESGELELGGRSSP